MHTQRIKVPSQPGEGITGSGFYRQTAAMGWKQRDSVALHHILMGHIPEFLKNLAGVPFLFTDNNGNTHEVLFLVTTDYLSIGNEDDWARVPLTPMTAQIIADSFDCFLPSPQMVDAIYHAAVVKLEPVPLFAFRDSTPSFWHHHLIIEGQRKGRKGLIAGIKKDVVRSVKYFQSSRSERVVIYGWHQLNGSPIQPVYAGHINWYVDYSHGIRLISKKIKVDGKWMRYEDLLKDPLLKPIVCDDMSCMSRY